MIQRMTMACPPDWQDKSMLILTATTPGQSGVSPNMVVTRDALPEGPTDAASRLEMFVEQQLELMRAQLTELEPPSRRSATASNATAEIKINWVSQGIPVTQWINYAVFNEAEITIASATAGRDDFADAEPMFRTMLQSFRHG